MGKIGTKWRDTSNHWSKGPDAEEIWAKIKPKLKLRKPNTGSFVRGYKSPRKGKSLPWAKKAAEARRASGMYERMKGNTYGFSKGNLAWNKGKKGVMPTPWNKGTHGKMPPAHNKGMGVGATLGGAIRNLPEYKAWRLSVFSRDLYTCQHCGAHGVELHADHIKPFALICRESNIQSIEDAINCELLWDTRNGQTLCIPCHRKTKTYSGKVQSALYTKKRR